ncbi:hypothetical protein [Acetobacter oryzifermentans]|uniref:Uncharacterized protein n=1 Tax=Acetobacter oryzifermentans TaxID=1633874 RepID=A0ABM6AK95_9PROT|nr:hypothetical protein [Acetobacter oryzifermentans]ANA14190.1 hypothetical protein WG31_09405 [Acetobacter oryzifermentans]
MPPTQAQQTDRYQFSADEIRNIESIVRRVVNGSKASSVASRNNIYDKTKRLLRVCHARVCQLDLAAMVDADLQIVLEDLGTLRRNLNPATAHIDYGTRLHFALNTAYRSKRQAA